MKHAPTNRLEERPNTVGRRHGHLFCCSSVTLAAFCAVASAGPPATPNPKPDSRPPNRAEFLPDVFPLRPAHRPRIDLNGPWAFRRDPDNRGNTLRWHEGEGQFPRNIDVPVPPQAQGIGEPTKKQKAVFLEPFWMRRRFPLPPIQPTQRVWIRIGGILPAAELYLNGEFIGFTKSSRTPQRVDVTRWARSDDDNLIAVKVGDMPEVRLCGLLEWNETTTTWSGAYRPIYAEITDQICIIDAYIQPDLDAGAIQVAADLNTPSGQPLFCRLVVKDGSESLTEQSVQIPPGQSRINTTLNVPNYIPWSPRRPHLYHLDIRLQTTGSPDPLDRVERRFGMREIRVAGDTFLLNGKPIFLNVYGEDHYYPQTLSPPADVDWYRPRLRRARDYGMNGVKGCVDTLPPEYLEAADEAGILVIQEMPFGLSWLRANRYTIGERFRAFYADELDGLIRISRNHPSVLFYSMSSELEFDKQNQQSFDFFSQQLPARTRELAPHALVIDCTGYLRSEDTPKGRRDTDFYATMHLKEVLDETPIRTDAKRPTILHEYNWWSCYPDPEDRKKYQNLPIQPYWLDTLERTAWANGQGELIRAYRRNSLWLQALARKDGIEFARRNPAVQGYILWLLVDYGPWSEGLLDDFWNPKNVSPAEFRQSNGDTVILLAREGDRSLAMNAAVRIPLAVSHYGERDLDGCTLTWTASGGPLDRQGRIEAPILINGDLTLIGHAALDLPLAEIAYRVDLRVELKRGDQSINTNLWSFWAFPEAPKAFRQAASPETAGKIIEGGVLLRVGEAARAPIPDAARLVVADRIDDSLLSFIYIGGRCLLVSRNARIENTGNHYGRFRTIPWNGGDSGNSGTLIHHHPALARFPHRGFCDLPFLYMFKGRPPLEFEPLRPYGVQPIIRGIDHYAANRNNAHLLEFKVGAGKVLATSLGVLDPLADRIEVRYFLKCLLDYARSDRFDPVAVLPREVFAESFRQRE